MKKLKGPELKMPELKTPAFLADLYYDLRDRRLLPLVALVVVAIGAVPFLLGGDEEAFVPQPTEPLSSLGASEKTSKLTVVEATPGLRDYRKRLAHRSPADPFHQRYTGLPAAAQLQSSSSTSEAGGATAPTESSSVAGTSPAAQGGAPAEPTPGDSGAGGGDGQSGPSLIQIVDDVQISHSEPTANGGQKMSEPEVRHDIRPFTPLPGEKAPVLTAMGASLHTGKALFLVSNEVGSLDGDFNCVARTPAGLCEMLEIEKGMQLEATYGEKKAVYWFKVVKFGVVRDGQVGDKRSPRAAFVGGPLEAVAAP